MVGKISQDILLQQRILQDVEDFGSIVSKFKAFYRKKSLEPNRIPYPYQDDAQGEYDLYSTKISSAMEMLDFVTSDLKKRMFELERNQSSPDNFNMSMNEQQRPEYVMSDQNEGNLIQRGLNKISGVKKKKIVNKNDPYQSAIPFFKRAYNIIENWDLHKDWHEEGCDFTVDEMNDYGYTAFLTNHRAIFSKTIEPDLLRIYQQGLTLRRGIEKNIIGNVLTKSLAELKTQEQNQMK